MNPIAANSIRIGNTTDKTGFLSDKKKNMKSLVSSGRYWYFMSNISSSYWNH
ncbi:MAG: hypothetical protein J6A61_04950 [Clostridia bacterium]|nr:hypothetical protein [Clostridia bacterium]